jgi:hypothetical protein
LSYGISDGLTSTVRTSTAHREGGTEEVDFVYLEGKKEEQNLNDVSISLFHPAFHFTIYNGPTNAFVCNKTLIQMSHTKTFKITPTCFYHHHLGAF